MVDYALGREAWVNNGRGGFRHRAVVYRILPPATAMVDYALGREASFLQPLPWLTTL